MVFEFASERIPRVLHAEPGWQPDLEVSCKDGGLNRRRGRRKSRPPQIETDHAHDRDRSEMSRDYPIAASSRLAEERQDAAGHGHSLVVGHGAG